MSRLVALIDGEFPPGSDLEDFTNAYDVDPSGQHKPMNSDLLQNFCWNERDTDPKFYDWRFPDHPELIAARHARRLDLTAIIDTPGGISTRVEQMTVLADMCTTFRTYVPRAASSAGAMIWLLGSERYITADTRMMWHVSPRSLGDREKCEADIQWILDLFRRAETRHTDTVENLLRDPWNLHHELIMRADELLERGVATHCFASQAEMRDHALEQLRMTKGTNPVSGLMQKIMQREKL